MKRADFKQIIKLRSYWKVDKRKGNFKLPNGQRLSDYIEDLIIEQLELDQLGISKEGELHLINKDFYKEQHDYQLWGLNFDEKTDFSEQMGRIQKLAKEITG